MKLNKLRAIKYGDYGIGRTPIDNIITVFKTEDVYEDWIFLTTVEVPEGIETWTLGSLHSFIKDDLAKKKLG